MQWNAKETLAWCFPLPQWHFSFTKPRTCNTHTHTHTHTLHSNKAKSTWAINQNFKMCLKTNHFQYKLITVKANMTITWLAWKSHESAGSSVEVETRDQSSAGLPAGSLSDCQTAPLTLETTEKRRMNKCKRWYLYILRKYDKILHYR